VAGKLYGTGYTEAYIAAAKRDGRPLPDDAVGPPASDENDVRPRAVTPSGPRGDGHGTDRVRCLPTARCRGHRQPTWNFNDKSRLIDRLLSKPVDNDPRNNPSFVREFLLMLAVCHTVIPERDRNRPDRTEERQDGRATQGEI